MTSERPLRLTAAKLHLLWYEAVEALSGVDVGGECVCFCPRGEAAGREENHLGEVLVAADARVCDGAHPVAVFAGLRGAGHARHARSPKSARHPSP